MIIGEPHRLAVARIESIEDFFNPNIDIDQLFVDTTICIQEKIDKILISINNELIVIDDQGVIFNLGNFDFVHNFKLKGRDTNYSLKNNFEKVT